MKGLVPIKVKERYEFSNYIIDTNKFRLRKVMRILALVMLFIKNMKIRREFANQIIIIFSIQI